MKSQMNHAVKLYIFISCLIFFGACTAKPDTFSVNLSHNGENVYLKHSTVSTTASGYTMGPADLSGKSKQTFNFEFELDDTSSIYYAYLSIETWDVEAHRRHQIILNNKLVGYLDRSINRSVGRWGNTPMHFEAKQINLPKEIIKQGKNKLTIKAMHRTDHFKIGRLSINVLNIEQDLKSDKVKSAGRTEKRYFPKQLRYLSKLTDEELYIAMVKLPSLITELNFEHGIYRKKLSYLYSRIGDYHRWNGDYTKNLLYQKKATGYETEKSSTTMIPHLKTKLGLAYYYVGDYELSLAEYQSAIKSLEAIDPQKLEQLTRNKTEDLDFLKAHIYAYIALSHYHLNKYDLAEEYAQKAGKITWDNFTAPIAGSLALQVQGHVAMQKKDYPGAATFYDSAIRSFSLLQRKFYNDQFAMAKLYLANAQFLEGHYKEAIAGINQVSEPTHEFKWRSHLLKGNISLAENRFVEAIDQYSQSIEEIEFSRAKLSTHGFKVNFMNDKQVPYQKIIGSLEKQGDNKKAFYYAEKAKARAFVDLIAAAKDGAYHKNSQLKELSSEEKHLRAELIDLQNKLDSERKKTDNRGVIHETKIELENARSALNSFYITKASQNVQFASLNAVDTLTIQEVKQLIPNGVTLVEYYYDPNHLYIWTIDNKQHRFLKKDILNSELEKLVKAYRYHVFEGTKIRGLKSVKAGEKRLPDRKSRFEEVNNALKSILLDGAFNGINSEKVYIVPHGILHYLPFQMLTYNSDYLIKKYQIGYIPSATALKYVLAKRKKKSINLLALGNPALNTPQMQLPFAEEEVRGLKAIYPTARVLVGKDASEANFKQQAGAHGIVHVASHGEFNSNTPLLSCLRLSAGNGEDGRLETREIFTLDLDAYLITLSACNTAIGKLTKGDDVVGLTRAFIFAGTPSILGTIWSVNDESTSIFMKHFYGNLREMDKLKSLQQAQIAMIRSEKYRHPYHWAGFQLIGDYH